MPSSGISFSDREQNNDAAAQNGFRRLLERLVILYTHGESSLISESELARLLNSLCYVLRLEEAGEEALAGLASRPDAFYARRLEALEAQMERLLAQWREICALMPPIRNVSLRDTLASIGQVKSMYDMRFAAHEVPCDIQYQLSEPVDERLQGLDYLEAWLAQLRWETEWIARFAPESCIAVLEEACPDYRGLHVNLFDLLKPHEGRLKARG